MNTRLSNAAAATPSKTIGSFLAKKLVQFIPIGLLVHASGSTLTFEPLKSGLCFLKAHRASSFCSYSLISTGSYLTFS